MRNFDGGRTAAVKLDSGQTVILTSKRVMPLSIETLATVGLTPASFKAIVAKGVHSPLAGYLPHVADVIRVDTPGVTSADPAASPTTTGTGICSPSRRTPVTRKGDVHLAEVGGAHPVRTTGSTDELRTGRQSRLR